ncbi:hypothetical protein [Cellvibrio japonicus]|uniref:Uncharacterized protein n=1 Tax=Cellvibrio japonicus (strain Ueda107) TaxID=498211 RepID=B3PFA6_CELJU|nr:hypothetical protein [Cellvibrio japonicus]ACE83746.1 hypothetical protein CJA_3420 [Cellvibrio japonicus Ueda107]QEI13655.1 hypothetical protein FY117_16510 [Cellvibrio japonicus]QEI17228.1 hypothetical protein FY116_16510 [Cellvibrio japonicus]QEI20806.1 hypothetical protein FY115_16510 [Cellvibrio japonicus]
MNYQKYASSLLPLCFCASQVLAATGQSNDYKISLSARSGMSDNATKSQDNAIDERQDEYRLNVGVNYSNSQVQTLVNYQAVEQRYAKDSQENDAYLDGASSLLWGTPDSPVDLLLKHSRRTLLQTPDQIDITNNLDERDIFTVIPSARLRVTSVDTLILSGDFTKIDYARSPMRDSEREGATLALVHLLSATDNLQFSVQHTDVSFNHLSSADYRYLNATLSYAAQLRQFIYRVQLGYNKTENDSQEDDSGGVYMLSAEYQSGLHKWSVLASRQITDSSLGDGNYAGIDGFPGSDGSDTVQQMERSYMEMRWDSSLLCERCALHVNLAVTEDDYLAQTEQADQRVAGIGFGYHFSRVSRFNLSYDYSQREFKAGLMGKDYDLARVRIGYTYEFANPLRLGILASREKRQQKIGDANYTENFVGMNLTYVFK